MELLSTAGALKHRTCWSRFPDRDSRAFSIRGEKSLRWFAAGRLSLLRSSRDVISLGASPGEAAPMVSASAAWATQRKSGLAHATNPRGF
jgi:hypothetical protein